MSAAAASHHASAIATAITVVLVLAFCVSGWFAVTGVRRAARKRRAWLRERDGGGSC